MRAISATDMQELDRQTIASGVSGERLMERAGVGAYRHLLAFAKRFDVDSEHHFLIVTGKGNNGGDGHVIARYLAEAGYATTVFSVCPLDQLSGDAATNAQRLPATVTVVVGERLPDELLETPVIVVDCLLGTGIAGAVREPYTTLIEQVNDSAIPVVAVDIPSGVNATTGVVENCAIVADLTITMAVPKMGLFAGVGPDHRGMLRTVDIGIPPEFVSAKTALADVITAADVRPHFGRLGKRIHKGSMGRIFCVGGSTTFPGAIMLAGSAALRSGGGLVTAVFPASAMAMMRPHDNALILHPVEDAGLGVLHHDMMQSLGEHVARQDIVAIGPGMTDRVEAVGLAAKLLQQTVCPVVVDADALRVIERTPPVLPRKGVTVLTPHPGEMARIIVGLRDLTVTLDDDRRVQAAGVAERLGCYVVLKGADTVIAAPDGRVRINSSGVPGLASGGTGDVLTGMIAAMLHAIPDPFDAVSAAVFLHGRAAEMSTNAMRHLVADDLLILLGRAMRDVSPVA